MSGKEMGPVAQTIRHAFDRRPLRVKPRHRFVPCARRLMARVEDAARLNQQQFDFVFGVGFVLDTLR